jgi:hypothetical protein
MVPTPEIPASRAPHRCRALLLCSDKPRRSKSRCPDRSPVDRAWRPGASESALPLACPYNPVDLFDLFGQPVVFNPTGQEIPLVRIVAWWHINHAFVQAPNEFLP